LNFFENLSNASGSFTLSQKVIAGYMLDHIESIAFSNLEAISNKIGVSTTTVIRFSRALGYDGFSDMQKAVKYELQHKSALPDRLSALRNDCENDLLVRSFSIDQENISQTLAAQKDEDLRAAVDWIINSRCTFILGMRSSYAIAHYMASRLGEIKKNVRFIQSTGMLYPEEIVGAEPVDVCIAYLFPRYSKIATNILGWLRSRGIRVILITALSATAVEAYGDIVLRCAIRSISYKNSLTAPLCLTNYLVAELARKNYDEAKEVLSRTEDILSSGYYLGI
jgi:DNA-binding MurR/RpiR family transcriptional regulator